ncbi:phosphonate C-P lyase system protein PhnG [Salipiger abyssi]|uniref:Alpha-D-ribose 1-methylphosphonate 5-triphosphate synthase subunit PhnG n=1 Tax=Salipiger abyssi TaxID=1250539 RepID=A0A1P8UX43_9RHOB|nr:phosphonate C-P lyase system protein PhnG [Salipiger abyssi]APZ53968.1 alpha-D-ribose 1-methylphosphonate 5-triphosphate synthase subunit PhnG [Salipiger abyssi]
MTETAVTEASERLSVLARMAPERISEEAEILLPALGDIEVLQSRSGLVMLPMRDTVTGTDFHLGEVLVSEAHIRLPGGTEGYGMVTGHDLERAMAMAVIDGALAAGVDVERLIRVIAEEAARQAEDDRDTLRAIEATRVDMETF